MMKPPSKKAPSTQKDLKTEEPSKRFSSTRKPETGVNISKDSLKQQPSQLPKYRRPVDVLSYANEILEKASEAEKQINDPWQKEQGGSMEHFTQMIPVPSSTSVKPDIYRISKEVPNTKGEAGSDIRKRKETQYPQTSSNPDAPSIPNPSASKELYQQMAEHQRREMELLSKVDSLGEELHQLQKQADKKYTTLSK